MKISLLLVSNKSEKKFHPARLIVELTQNGTENNFPPENMATDSATEYDCEAKLSMDHSKFINTHCNPIKITIYGAKPQKF